MKDSNNKEPILLSLSGGGFRGYFQAKILEQMEKHFGSPIANKFNIIAGTSIGGINALALAAEISASDMVRFYKEQGPKIFKKKKLHKLNPSGFFIHQYDDTPLKDALQELFQNKAISDLKHEVLIPAVNYSTGQPKVFKTAYNGKFLNDQKYKLVDVALATSAAPTFFPIHKMEGDDGCFMVDGGLIANHPGLYACVEAEKSLSVPKDKIKLLHIGTMGTGVTHSYNGTNSGFRKWKGSLFDLSISAQEKATENILNMILGENNYFKINSLPSKQQDKYVALDNASPEAISILAQQASCAYLDAEKKLELFLKEGDKSNE